MHFEDFKTWHWVIIGLLVGALFSGVKMYAGPWYTNADIDTLDQMRFEHALIGQPDGGNRTNAQMLRYLVGKQMVKDVVVHPPTFGDTDGKYWVTGKIATMEPMNQVPSDPKTAVVPAEIWRPFKYPADAPYQEIPPNVKRAPSRTALLAATRAATRPAAIAAAAKKKKAATNPTTAAAAATATPAIPQIKIHHTVVEYLQSKQSDPNAHFSYRYAWQENKAAMAILPPIAGLLIIGIAWPVTLGLMQH
ncbi:MAG TPA: hypothetical protein VLI90_15595, partial [Tepidisphaeraceae bacterium]|nr:hypothetical protein [Tepidisphaeraceae bacterium]